MKITFIDRAKRVDRFLHRTTPGGELIVLDLTAWFRGEIYYLGGSGTTDEITIRCTRTNGAADPEDAQHLIFISYPRRGMGRRVFVNHAKSTLYLLLAPLHTWIPSRAKQWTAVCSSQ